MAARAQLPLLEARVDVGVAARESWRQAFMSGQAPQLRAAERLLRNIWVTPLTVLRDHLYITDWEPDVGQFCEVALVTLCWEGGVDTA
eukprot:3364209-Amphidinium_carterae.1